MIRVALRVQPPVLRSLLEGLLAADDEVQVLADTGDDAPADVVVLSQPDPDNDTAPLSMLYRSPRTRVLALGTDARRSVLYELRPHRTALGELSRESLLGALRGTPPGAR